MCTGNICRSPFVERVLRSRLGTGAGVRVVSAGTHASEGAPMTPEAAGSVRSHGGDPGGFGARALTADRLAEADLVLALTAAHRRVVRSLAPSCPVVLLSAVPALVGRVALQAVSPAERLVELAAAVRGAGWVDEPADDVPDPYGSGPDAYAAAAALMVPPVELLARTLLGEDLGGRPPAGGPGPGPSRSRAQ